MTDFASLHPGSPTLNVSSNDAVVSPGGFARLAVTQNGLVLTYLNNPQENLFAQDNTKSCKLTNNGLLFTLLDGTTQLRTFAGSFILSVGDDGTVGIYSATGAELYHHVETTQVQRLAALEGQVVLVADALHRIQSEIVSLKRGHRHDREHGDPGHGHDLPDAYGPRTKSIVVPALAGDEAGVAAKSG